MGGWEDDLSVEIDAILEERVLFEEAEKRLDRLVLAPDDLSIEERKARVGAALREMFPNEFTWSSPEHVLWRIAKQGDPVPTGLDPIDKLLRQGGVPPGRVVLIGAPPGGLKTMLATMLLNELSKRIPAVGLFYDEGIEQATVRIGQQNGLDRGKLEAGDPETIRQLREQLRGRSLTLVETENRHATLETAFEVARKFEEAPVRAVVADSVQTIRLTAKQEADPEEREAISDFMWTGRRWAKRDRVILFVVAQAARTSYRTKKDAEEINPLATFAGSRAIEHACDVAIVLDAPSQETGTSRVRVPRNRIGDLGTFYVRLDRASATLIHEDPAAAQAHQEEQNRQAAEIKWDTDERRIRETLRLHPGKSQAVLGELLRANGNGNGKGIRERRLVAILDVLRERGTARFEGGGNGRPRHWFPTDPEDFGTVSRSGER